MSVYLVRHGDAKSRSSWPEADHLRPLTKKGERQARGLITLYDSTNIRRVLSSPAVRCMTTVGPLAAKMGVEVQESKALAEGADVSAAYKLLRDRADAKGDSVLCAHGDLIPELLRAAARDGLKLRDEARWAKGSTWLIGWDHGRFTEARYLPAPEE
jgi:8-oxo-dGTP diphosphatase